MIKLKRLYEQSSDFSDLEVDSSSDKELEISHARSFEWTPPIKKVKVSDIDGKITEGDIQLRIMFDNSGSLGYVSNSRLNKLLIDGIMIDSKWFNEYSGKTGSVIGDLLLLYSDYKDNKINPRGL